MKVKENKLPVEEEAFSAPKKSIVKTGNNNYTNV